MTLDKHININVYKWVRRYQTTQEKLSMKSDSKIEK